ncbi:MAG: CPBP family intramembrane metalloprotease [bacterium]|nr:CPBP family intramembrane metalloprotease [bacterium]
MSRTGSVVRAVLGVELRQLIRDRRALLTAILLPALLYPLIFQAGQWVEDVSEKTLAEREVAVALDTGRADAEVVRRARELLAARTPIELIDVDAQPVFTLEEGEAESDALRPVVRELLGDTAQLLLTAQPHPSAPRRTLFQLYYEVKDDGAREAQERARGALRELEAQIAAERRDALLGGDPAAGLDLAMVDVATAEAARGAELGRLLPFLAVLILISGGAYAALAVFAGEREAGTLETLLVQPVPTHAVAWGKFLAVLVAGLTALFANLASLIACVAFRLGPFANEMDEVGGIGLARIAGSLSYLPGCVLLCAVLCLVCGRARTFREGQMTLLPITLATALPSAIVLKPEVQLDFLWAVVPFAGPALAMRDGLRGGLQVGPLLLMIAAHAVYAGFALSRLSSILDAERILRSEGDEQEATLRRANARHALRWGFVSVLALYVIGGRVQQWDPVYGLLLTLWVLVVALAIGCAARTKRPLLPELGLTLPHPAHVLGAVLLVPGLVMLARWYLPVQQEILPLPSSMAESAAGLGFLEDMTPLAMFGLLALTPGICEELLFRGALLSSLKQDLRWPRILFWEALLFAAAHASIYRIVPTAFLGAVLAAITLRTRSIVPAVLVHVGYNGTLVLADAGSVDWTAQTWFTVLAWAAPVGIGLLALRRPRAD